MKGVVKWFSQEKGYGFIVGKDGADRYFHISEVQGVALPGHGDEVSFDEKPGSPGQKTKAVNIKIIEKKSGSAGERVTCLSCNKQMIPRIILERTAIFDRMVPSYSICPFCGKRYKSFDTGCFIATVIYQHYDHPQVRRLRQYRDTKLAPTILGRIFIKYYYRFSPSIAVWLEHHPKMTKYLRGLLDSILN